MHKDGCGDDEHAARLCQWAHDNFAKAGLHPVGRDEGEPRKDLWPVPEHVAEQNVKSLPDNPTTNDIPAICVWLCLKG